MSYHMQIHRFLNNCFDFTVKLKDYDQKNFLKLYIDQKEMVVNKELLILEVYNTSQRINHFFSYL
jgi:hypothetical protein